MGTMPWERRRPPLRQLPEQRPSDWLASLQRELPMPNSLGCRTCPFVRHCNPLLFFIATKKADYFLYILDCSGLPARSAWPRWAQSSCCSGVIEVGVSPAGTELHRIVSSNPGAEKMNVRLMGS
jgi:hypothetical protein